jgi:SET domain-containing protein
LCFGKPRKTVQSSITVSAKFGLHPQFRFAWQSFANTRLPPLLSEWRPGGVHGLGAFATCALPAFALLGLYEGRRYSQREVASKVWDDQLTYLFTLSNHETIDGAKGGNGTRHLNHACDPNCEAVEEYDDAGRLLLKFQTIVPVDAGDELFIDYCLTADDGSPPSNYLCRCGSSNCRGTMLAAVEAT